MPSYIGSAQLTFYAWSIKGHTLSDARVSLGGPWDGSAGSSMWVHSFQGKKDEVELGQSA